MALTAALNQGTFPGVSTADFLYTAVSAGVNLVELRTLGHAEPVAEIAAAVRDTGVRVLAINSLMDWALPDDPDPAPMLARLLEVAEAVAAPLIICVAPLRTRDLPPPSEIARYAVERLAELADLARPSGVRLALEQVGRSSTRPDVLSGIRRLDDALAIVSQVEDACLVVDSYNLATAATAFSDVARLPSSRLGIAHVADMASETGRRCLPGTGVLDISAFVHALAAAGYVGGVSIETFPDTPWSDPTALALEAVARLNRLLEPVPPATGRAGGSHTI